MAWVCEWVGEYFGGNLGDKPLTLKKVTKSLLSNLYESLVGGRVSSVNKPET